MLPIVLRVVGVVVLLLWGIVHMLRARSIVRGFGEISADNRRIVVGMALFEAVGLVFVAASVGLITYYGAFGDTLETILVNATVGFLYANAFLGAWTKARTKSVPMRLCPWVEAAVGTLFLLSNLL
ncbi:MAG: hypothetical protein PHX77_07595 [Candidatus Bipolaricaulis sp.]|nr:hypothetical protein [Candidatus Bipolaricaulis sp.]